MCAMWSVWSRSWGVSRCSKRGTKNETKSNIYDSCIEIFPPEFWHQHTDFKCGHPALLYLQVQGSDTHGAQGQGPGNHCSWWWRRSEMQSFLGCEEGLGQCGSQKIVQTALSNQQPTQSCPLMTRLCTLWGQLHQELELKDKQKLSFKSWLNKTRV